VLSPAAATLGAIGPVDMHSSGCDEGLSSGGDCSFDFEIDVRLLHLQEKVGAGCTAEVFRGTYGPVAEEVAVKQIDWNKSNMGQKEIRAFDREVSIMPRLTHDNLVKFIGVASLERPFRIITEFCSGGCVFELLHNCDHVDLCWPQQGKMCMDVASAMKYLHQFNPQIIHRDLKSLNLLLAYEIRGPRDSPIVKVSDFGLSRMKEAGQESWGKMTIAAGTCHWMAPEVFQGTNYTEKVDVYSYAMILFEIICREIPFEDEEPAMVGKLTTNGQRPDMEAVPPDCPEELSNLMQVCWDKEPSQRLSFEQIETMLVHILSKPQFHR
jgi:serine/threonine protein kinase